MVRFCQSLALDFVRPWLKISRIAVIFVQYSSFILCRNLDMPMKKKRQLHYEFCSFFPGSITVFYKGKQVDN